jgi:hypothetical protein
LSTISVNLHQLTQALTHQTGVGLPKSAIALLNLFEYGDNAQLQEGINAA